LIGTRHLRITFNAKARVFENQAKDDFTSSNADDSTTAGLSDRTRAQLFWFSRKKEIEKGAFARGRISISGTA